MVVTVHENDSIPLNREENAVVVAVVVADQENLIVER